MTNFNSIYQLLGEDLLRDGRSVETHWQATTGVPQNRTLEYLNASFTMMMPADVFKAEDEIAPTLPWAEEHFQERVSRIPHNPPPSAERWLNSEATKDGVDAHRDEEGKFSHTYPERFWPKSAGDRDAAYDEWVQAMPRQVHRAGIRYPYGDLDDVVSLLAREPYTRQSYLPVWFPEDTGAVPGERVPCTLGYHWILRDGKLHCFYPMRSCDFLRHFRNDVYFAVRLTQWILGELRGLAIMGDHVNWHNVTPGLLTMHIVSLHVFEGDLPYMRQGFQEVDEWSAQ